jgi:hypothetical protein
MNNSGWWYLEWQILNAVSAIGFHSHSEIAFHIRLLVHNPLDHPRGHSYQHMMYPTIQLTPIPTPRAASVQTGKCAPVDTRASPTSDESHGQADHVKK